MWDFYPTGLKWTIIQLLNKNNIIKFASKLIELGKIIQHGATKTMKEKHGM